MAMLAEKREKKVIRSYMLKSKPLTSESCKVGQRLLEKMGWTPGKGLGINEDGSPDPLHIKFKCDIKGLGFKHNEKDALSCQEDFNALLAKLSQQEDHGLEASSMHNEGNAVNSLESLSRKSRARVHYQKFTRGKDLSRATSKDLASILGFSGEKVAGTTVIVDALPLPLPSDDQNGITEKQEGQQKQKTKENGFLPGSFLENTQVPTEIHRSKKKKKKRSKENTKTLNSLEENTLMTENSFSGRRKSVTWGDVQVSYVSKYISDMVDTSNEFVQLEEAAPLHLEDSKKVKRNGLNACVSTSVSQAAGSATTNIEISSAVSINAKKKERSSETFLCSSTSDECLGIHAPDHGDGHIELDSGKKCKENRKKRKKGFSSDFTDEEKLSEAQGSQGTDCHNRPCKKRKKQKNLPEYDAEILNMENHSSIKCWLDVVKNSDHGDPASQVLKIQPVCEEEEESHKEKKRRMKREKKDQLEVVHSIESRNSKVKLHSASTESSSDKTVPAEFETNSGANSDNADMVLAGIKKKLKKKNCSHSTKSFGTDQVEEIAGASDQLSSPKTNEKTIELQHMAGRSEKVKGISLNSESKKKKKKQKDYEISVIKADLEINGPITNSEKGSHLPSIEPSKDENEKASIDQHVIKLCTQSSKQLEGGLKSDSNPILSLITKERMAKWKKRQKSLPVSLNDKDCNTTIASKPASKLHSGTVVTLTSKQKKVKRAEALKDGPVNFVGSNLETIRGYGCTIGV